MGAACCIAAKDRTITSVLPGESLQRHFHYSPTWSFRWENRGRVVGEETHANWLQDGGCGNDRMEVKSSTTAETAFASEEGSPLDCSQSLAWQKSPASEGNTGNLRLQSSDQVSSQDIAKVESRASSSVSQLSPVKLSPSVPSVSPISTSPLSTSSHHHMLPPNTTPSKWHHHSPGHRLLRQVSDSRTPEYKSRTLSISEENSLFLPPAWGNDSTRASNAGSSNSSSIPDFMTRRERWSFDSETSSFSREKISEGNSSSLSFDAQICGICLKLLTERSSLRWSTQVSSYDLAVVSVLTCGHVYHAECLESTTPETHRYDPACPVCTVGEKRASKMYGKALKAEMDPKARKRFRKYGAVTNLSDDIIVGHPKSGGVEGTDLKMSSSSSMKSSLGKPFLRRHFSFGSKTSRSLSENKSTARKGFFWTRSSKY